jgi:plasmid maintenance system antidote protein VapI
MRSGTMAKKLKPIHPGEQLHEEFMVPPELSSNAPGESNQQWSGC